MKTEIKKLRGEDFFTGRKYQIGETQCSLKEVEGYSQPKRYFFSYAMGSNELIYTRCGVNRKDIEDFLGRRVQGVFPELTLPEIVKIHNWLIENWAIKNGLEVPPDPEDVPDEPTKVQEFVFDDGELLEFPYLVASQEDWDSFWPKLKKAGFMWSDGEELGPTFSECHEFPEHIETTDLENRKITIAE